MTTPEFARPEFARHVKVRALPAGTLRIEADAAERAALAARFGVSAVNALSGAFIFEESEGRIVADGQLEAEIVQPCAVTQEDFTYAIAEPLHLVFVPAAAARAYAPDEEIELEAEELDEIAYEGESLDLGEATAQSLALAIDPYREGPGADAARAANRIVSDEDVAPSGPLAEALRALRPD